MADTRGMSAQQNSVTSGQLAMSENENMKDYRGASGGRVGVAGQEGGQGGNCTQLF